MKHGLLMVVDMINGFVCEGALADKSIGRIVGNIDELIQKFNPNDVLFVVDAHDNLALEFNSFPSHCVEGSNEAMIIDELNQYATNILYKNSTNAFHKLDKDLLEKYDDFIIVGCCTDICIMTLALSLKTYFNEYNISKRVIVINDACDTYHNATHNKDDYNLFAINIMQQAGVKVMNTKEYMHEI